MALKDEEISYEVIGAAMEVHRVLGHGFLEGVYQEALEIELQNRATPFSIQTEVPVAYKGVTLKCFDKPDFIVRDKIIVGIKALSKLTGIEEAQILNYLKATRIELGLLIKFGAASLEWKRMVLS
jgi:GxxExxY protein